MPKTTARGEVEQSELPSTLRRSDEKAQRTFAEAHDAALEQYDGNEKRAHRVACAALKHSYEKTGDHWEPKPRRGPSGERAEIGGPGTQGETAEGVDANAPKEHLLAVARRLSIPGRSRMTKDELVEAIERRNRQETQRARE
ncbi:ChaB family protein [Nocardia sp. NBC_00508]|uniref:ChaB family protein n=1 Tax=Nocardia sp. NBC_00508 TaxID=2975992 RepID=UPI002E823235|nr:ChaB family protein [Nocardia sp. NBC_00508]WUD66403.1 ChaB family protein [Nocardia sp. NBC_00508]